MGIVFLQQRHSRHSTAAPARRYFNNIVNAREKGHIKTEIAKGNNS